MAGRSPRRCEPSGRLRRALAEIWFNLVPMLFEVALPAFAAGMTFPLANALVQTSPATVGRRAGLLYFANTAGAVGGSLAAGYLLLPWLGMQAAAAVLAGLAAAAIVPLLAAGAARARGCCGVGHSRSPLSPSGSRCPPDFVVRRASPVASGERVLTRSEGHDRGDRRRRGGPRPGAADQRPRDVVHRGSSISATCGRWRTCRCCRWPRRAACW